MPNPIVSILIVAADSGPSLHDCARRALAVEGAELILADNASTDGVPQAIEREWAGDGRLRVLYNGANLGFGAAMNRAAAQARGEMLLILNPDCLLEADTVPRLLAALRESPRNGLVGAVVCDARGEPDPASRRHDPLFLRALATLSGRGGEGVAVAGPIPHETLAADAVSGALMLMPRALFEHLGGFDEGYFLHCEDLDLCRRVRDAGYRVLLAGDVRVLHAKGGSSRHRPVFVSWHKHRGMWRWFRKFDPSAHRPPLAATVWLGIWAHFLLRVPAQLLKRRRA
jgi:hypothetical protein